MTPDDQLHQFSGGTNDLAMDGLWYSHARVTQLVEAARLAAVQECRDRDMTEADVRARLTDAEQALARVSALRDEWEQVGKHDQAAKRAAGKLRAALDGKP